VGAASFFPLFKKRIKREKKEEYFLEKKILKYFNQI